MNQTKKNSNNLAPFYETEHYMPEYKTGEYGKWRISIMGLGHDYGYTTGVWMVNNVPILSRCDNNGEWETWMSLTPHEIESQELGAKYSFGHVVVMGLGLGWLAVNAAMNSRVSKVTVIEIDPSVIELLHSSGALDGLSDDIRSKITVVCEDALKWKSGEKVDFLYADIWKSLNEESALNDVRIMQNNLNASVIYYWGQELTIYNEINNNKDKKEITHEGIKHVIKNRFDLPLLIPKEIDYPEMIKKVIENRKKRGLRI